MREYETDLVFGGKGFGFLSWLQTNKYSKILNMQLGCLSSIGIAKTSSLKFSAKGNFIWKNIMTITRIASKGRIGNLLMYQPLLQTVASLQSLEVFFDASWRSDWGRYHWIHFEESCFPERERGRRKNAEPYWKGGWRQAPRFLLSPPLRTSTYGQDQGDI